MKAVVFTLGCKVNEVESASIMAALERGGWEVSDKLGYADAYVLNTCAVTREAEKKSRQLVARAKKYNPAAAIYVLGCASVKNGQAFWEKGAEAVFKNADKDKVIRDLCSELCGAQDIPFPKNTKTRAFIKIQDGCNNFCSYCVIPYLRGREKSRSIGDICREIESCACPEVVLTGINISSYNDGGKGLSALVSALKGVEKRIRLGSLECTVVNGELLKALKELKDFAPHFHLSLQSGSDSVLKAMNRKYTRGEYLEKCELIYGFFPKAAITADIISGFPTETEEDFAQSLSIIEEAGLARVHAFSFSPREGTAAFKMKDLPAEVKSERISRLIAASEQAEKKFIKKFTGETLGFIAEEWADGFTGGYTGNYIRAYVPAKLVQGKKYNVKITGLHADGALCGLSDEI